MTIRGTMPRCVLLTTVVGVAMFAASCRAGVPVAPDALRPESFELSLVDGQSLSVPAYPLSVGGWVWIKSARLKSIVTGRNIDPRIFDDRSGNGTTGGSSRDSTTASALVADIREFEERTGKSTNSSIVGMHTDTSSATIERRGDLLIIIRDGPIARLVMVDTGRFIDGKLVITAHEWERFSTPANAKFVYTITK